MHNPEHNNELTPKQEAFAQAYVETGIATEAHRRAGYGANMTDKTRNEAASRLLANSKVRTRVAQLMEQARKRHEVTIDSLCTEFDENRKLALESSQPAAANGATTGKARLHGLDKADSGVQVNVQQNTVTEISDLELARRLANILETGAIEADVG